MKKILIIVAALCGTIGLHAQGETDALKFSQTDLNGSARFMSMAGAFGALGGDISSLTQNPAGIGVYRSSEIVTTFGFANLSNSVSASGGTVKDNQFRGLFNNIGAIGTINTGNSTGLVSYNVGFSFNRQKSFNREYRAHYNDLNTSITNYVANRTNGISLFDLTYIPDGPNQQDPYNYLPWLPVLGYEGNFISPVENLDGNTNYFGLFDRGHTTGYGDLFVKEKGRLDEYSINLGANVSDRFYLGMAVGIYDLSYDLRTGYSESLTNPVYNDNSGNNVVQQNGNIGLRNVLTTTGSGVNFKMGAIFRPTNFLRLGFAFHTPTFFSMRDEYYASTENTAVLYKDGDGVLNPIYRNTPDDKIYYTSYKLKTPWRLIASAAFVIGKKGILSADYEYAGYNKMSFSNDDDYYNSQDMYSQTNDYIKQDLKAGHTLRIGGEYRVTPQLSLRAGFSRQWTPIKTEVLDQNIEIVTAGTATQYTLDRGTNYYTCGAGYRFGQVFVDLAYVHKYRSEDVLAFSPTFVDNLQYRPEVAKLSGHTNSLVVTLGYKF
ncbi:OmpP1/FadL family transporter [Coprobacter tertius]|uniref:Outer membrane protein transport protein n=1 Tax=Coprobacter tertius TaxID=2944915 RepID=A0ABT1MJI8_9BACT|nr:outer membrane protein transport protein [Coprobacter tertius]MCP9611406.1 outer membrane protein transport protein [Coprobacter tertius]